MALTLVREKELMATVEFESRVLVDFDASYPTGGELFDADLFTRGEQIEVRISPAFGYTFSYDATNKKILAWVNGAQVANATDLSGVLGVLVNVISKVT